MSWAAEPAAPQVQRFIALFEGLTRDDLARLGEFYADAVHFSDPFNDVRGVAALRRVFAQMFDELDSPSFVVIDRIVDGNQAFLSWDFGFRRRRGRAICIHGASHLRFGDDGRVVVHRDYWDAAQQLYEKLPLIGGPMRWLRRRLAAR